jgi:hypothetical protein
MPLNENALLTLAEGTTYLGVGSDQDVVIEDIINRASDYCEWWAKRPLKARDFEDLRLAAPCGTILRPPATPIDIDEDITIADVGTALSVWRSEGDGDPALKDVVIGCDTPGVPSHFVRALGWRPSARNPFPIVLTYTGGFATIPGELQEAAYLIVENIYRAQEKKLTDVVAIGSGPGAPGITFRGELIPMKAKQILDSYRVFLV